jgi:site-specific DNA recombinase
VSTTEQVEGTSLASQVERCETYIAAQGWAATATFVDEGVSGAKASRPALDALMTQVRADAIDVVVVAKLDRIGRSMRHLAALLGELDDRNVVLVSVAEAFDSSTPAGRLQRNMLGSFAEFEREQIRDRMSVGRDATIRQGKYVSTHAPYGYRIVTSGRGRHLELDPAEAEVLRLAIELFVNHRLTTGQVATELNSRGFKPRRAARWSGHGLRVLFRTADHVSGTWTWRHPRHHYQGSSITMSVPPIVDTTTHDRLGARLAETTRSQSHRPDRYLLAGRIFTPHGTLMYGLTNPSRMYRCSDVFRNNAPPGGRACDCRQIRAQLVEDAVWAEICALLSNPARLLSMAGLHLTRGASALATSADDLAAMDRRIARLEKAAGERLSRLLADGLDPAVASHTAKGLTDELIAARKHRQQMAAWLTTNAERRDRTHRLMELAQRAQQILPVADTGTKQRILSILAVRVQVECWEPCSACNGIGYLSTSRRDAVAQSDPSRKRGNADTICPTCRRHRWLPRFVIEGMVPEADLDTGNSSETPRRWPFRVVGGDT